MNDTMIELGNASPEDRIGYQSKASTYAQAAWGVGGLGSQAP